MTKRLRESDRRAVDLLLDRAANGSNGNGYVRHAPPASEPGMMAVQRVLNLLDVLPAAEPATDLLTRTMSRIESGRISAPHHPAAAALMTDRPHA